MEMEDKSLQDSQWLQSEVAKVMLAKYINGNSVERVLLLLVLLALAVFAIPAFAQGGGGGSPATTAASNLTTLSPQTILANIQNALPKLTQMVTAIAFVIGIFMVI